MGLGSLLTHFNPKKGTLFIPRLLLGLDTASHPNLRGEDLLNSENLQTFSSFHPYLGAVNIFRGSFKGILEGFRKGIYGGSVKGLGFSVPLKGY